EAQRQPDEPPHERADRQVRPLNVRGAYRAGLLPAAYVEYAAASAAHYFRGSIGPHRIAKFFHDGSELDVRAKGQIDRFRVARKAIGADMNHVVTLEDIPGHKPRAQVHHEPSREVRRPLADGKAGNQLRVGVQGHIDELVANPIAFFSFGNASLFLADERPDFIALDVA